MSAHSILLVAIISQVAYIVGELLFKAAMDLTTTAGHRSPRFAIRFLGGCVGIATSFFLWLGLLAERPLSYLFPFQSLNAVVIAIGAAVFLGEKLTPRLVLSIVLVTMGVGLVLAS
ncbi:MAG: EamA family transporter [Chthoniobacteraceae bacterium]